MTGEKQRADNRPCFTDRRALLYTRVPRSFSKLDSSSTRPCDPFRSAATLRATSATRHEQEQQRQRVDHATDGALMSPDEKRTARDVEVVTHKSEAWP